MKTTINHVMAMALCAMALQPALARAQTAAATGQPAQAVPGQGTSWQAPLEPGQFLSNAGRTLAMLDQGQIGQVWDVGSTALKQAATRDAFVSHLRAGQAKLGNAVRREWVSIAVHNAGAGAGPKLPEGRYVSVTYSSAFANANAREVVSFRKDPDGQWRVTGYVVN